MSSNNSGETMPVSESDVPRLIEALGSGDPHERSEAVCNLGYLYEAAAEAVPALIEALQSEPCWETRGFMASTLGQIGREEAVPHLVAALHDESWWVRGWAAFGLGQTGGEAEQAIPRLIELMHDDESWYVRAFAASALGYLGKGDESVISALIDATGDEDGNVRGDAGLALAVAGAKHALPIITGLLEDPHPSARQQAAEALGYPGFRERAENNGEESR